MKTSNSALDLKGITVLIILCASWGLNQVAIKVAVQSISPVLQAGIRSMGAAVLVLLWMKFRGIPVLSRDRTLWWGLGVGFLFSAEFVLIYWGLEYTNASRSAIFLNTAPFAVALGAWLFIPGEKLTRVQVSGLVLAFIGVLAAFNESLCLPSRQMLLGDAMIVGAAVLWGATTVIIKSSPLAFIPPSKALFYQLGISAVILPIASPVFREPGVMHMTPVAVASLFYQIVWVAFITYIAWFWLIRNYAVSRIASFTFLSPVFGVMAGALILGEPISLYLVCALALVGTGIYLVNRR
jgi:drug/metabolite transporter (DMT)-like permease